MPWPRRCSSSTRWALEVSRPLRRSVAVKPLPTTSTVVLQRHAAGALGAVDGGPHLGLGAAQAQVAREDQRLAKQGVGVVGIRVGHRVGAFRGPAGAAAAGGSGRKPGLHLGHLLQGGAGGLGHLIPRGVVGVNVGHGQLHGGKDVLDAVGAVLGGNVHHDAGAGPRILGGVVVVEQRHAGLLGHERQGVGRQRVVFAGEDHRARVVKALCWPCRRLPTPSGSRQCQRPRCAPPGRPGQ